MRSAIIIFFITCFSFAQTDIEIIQFSASFVIDNEISLKKFKYQTRTIYMSENPDKFKKHKLKYIPTIILFKDGNSIDTKVGLPPKKDLLDWIKANT